MESQWTLKAISKDELIVQEKLQDRGKIKGESLRSCIPVIRNIIEFVCDYEGIPMQLHRKFTSNQVKFSGTLPLDETAGVKLALIFKLQEQVNEINRVKLIANRVERFTREEAAYWFSLISYSGEIFNRWAQEGLGVVLSGEPNRIKK